MHELGIAHGVIHAIEDRANGRRVEAVGVRIGVLERVVPDAFEQSFRISGADTIAADASIELTTVPVDAHCRACGHAFTSNDDVPACPECGELAVATTGGSGIVLEWLRFAPDATPVATATIEGD